MRDSGKILFLAVILIILGIFFSVFGFSEDTNWRYGQYFSVVVLSIFFLDEFFRD